MARTAKPKRKGQVDTQGDRLLVDMSSGYRLIIRRPSINVVRAINKKAFELYPDPDPPTTQVQAATGATYSVPDPDREQEYEAARQEAASLRLEYLLDYIFKNRLEVQGYETEEDRAALIEKYADERKELEEWGSIPDDMAELDDWQFTLRTFIVADNADYVALMLAASKAFDVEDLTDQEVRQRVQFF